MLSVLVFRELILSDSYIFLSGRGSFHPLLMLPPLSLVLPLLAEVELDCLTETLVVRFSAGTSPAVDSSKCMSAIDSSARS